MGVNLPGESTPQRVLHGQEEADLSLAHHTVAGQLMERDQLQQQQPSSPSTNGVEDSAALVVNGAEGGDYGHANGHSTLSSSPRSPASPSPSSPSPQPSASLTASSPPLPARSIVPMYGAPLRVPSPPPAAPLGYYECERCTALLSYASLMEVYHCPLCSHAFTLAPGLAPPPSHLFPLSYEPFPTLRSQVTHTWGVAELASFVRAIPALSHLVKRMESLCIDGKRFLEMGMEDFIDELGLWGGVGHKAVTNATTVVKLLETQAALREEPPPSGAAALINVLTGMQRLSAGPPVRERPTRATDVTKAVAQQQQQHTPQMPRNARLTGQPMGAGVMATQVAGPTPASAVAHRSSVVASSPQLASAKKSASPAPRKQYRIPNLTPGRASPQPVTATATATATALIAAVIATPASSASSATPVTATQVPDQSETAAQSPSNRPLPAPAAEPPAIAVAMDSS